jgi:hypothetical protein
VNLLSPLWVLILIGLVFTGRAQRRKAVEKAETVEGLSLPITFRWRPTTYLALGLVVVSLLVATLFPHAGVGTRYAIAYSGILVGVLVFWLGRAG